MQIDLMTGGRGLRGFSSGWWCAFLAASTVSLAVGAEVLEIDTPMRIDPQLELDRAHFVVPESLKPIWLKALKRPGLELRQRVADGVGEVYGKGLRGLNELVDQLVAILESDEPSVDVRRAAARALAAVDARRAAAVLDQQLAAGNLQLAQAVEPALAKWDYQPARERWLDCIRDPGSLRARLLLAIDAVGQTREPRAAEPLLIRVKNRLEPRNVRLASARALARVQTSGLVGESRKLAEANSSVDPMGRLLAAAIIAEHGEPQAIALLRQLAVDEAPAVAGMAFESLLNRDPAIVYDLAPGAIARDDARLRLLGAKALVVQGNEAAVSAVAVLLDDENPGVRRFVARSYVDLARKQNLAGVVWEQTMKTLTSAGWRGLEQAELVVGALDYEPAAQRLVELLEHSRGEVLITAAWALGRLQVKETLPALLAQARKQRGRLKEDPSDSLMVPRSLQVAQLFQMFGQMRFREAESLMREFVPKSSGFHEESRAAACWGLGFFYEDHANESLARQFAERLADLNPLDPERDLVRWMSAIALGRMKSGPSLEVLQNFARLEGRSSWVGRACEWSISQITGQPMPAAETIDINTWGWFLEPLSQQDGERTAPAVDKPSPGKP